MAETNTPVKGSSQPPLQGQAKIDQMAADAQDNTDAAARALSGFTSQLTQVYGQIQQGAKEAAGAKEGAALTEQLARVKQQQATLEHSTALGTNPDAASFALDQIAQDYKQSTARANKFDDNIAYAMDPTNIVDNPLKYIGQLLMFDFNKEGQAAAGRSAQRSKEQYIGLNNMTQEYAQTQAAIAQTVTTETAGQLSKVAAYEITRQTQLAELEQLRTNSEMVMKALQLQNTPFEIERARQASENSAAHLAMARQAAAKQNAISEIQLRREMRADARESREAAKYERAQAADQATLEMINNAAAARNIPLRFNSMEELELASKSSELKPKIALLFNAGVTDTFYKQNSPTGTGIVSLGATPSDTLSMVTELGAKTSPGQAPVVGLISSTNAALLAGKPAPKNAAEAQAYNVALNSAVQETAARQYKDISAGSSNIYAPPPLQSLLDDKAFVAGAPYLAKEVFKTDKDLGSQTINFKGALQQVVAGIRDKKLTLEQADSELGYLAAKVMATNNALRQYDVTAGLPQMKNVNVPVWAGGSVTRAFTGAEPLIDLADPVKRRAYLSSQMASFIQPTFIEQAMKPLPKNQQGAK